MIGNMSFRCPFRANLVVVAVTQGGIRCATLPWADFRHPFGAMKTTNTDSLKSRVVIDADFWVVDDAL